ncbi:MAG: tRNA1(Val) (adenine(37)-N6)-methyltransferase [Eubacteriales bacterium]
MHLEDWSILKENETLDDLQANGYKIIQSNNHFKFSIDAVLLSHFTSFKKNNVIMDMCSGTGVVALLVCAHNDVNRIDCVEIQQELFEMCKRSIKYNNLQNIITPYNMDLRDSPKSLGYETYDAVLCNPPYLPLSAGKSSLSQEKKIARFEVFGDLEDIISASSKLLKNIGKLILSHRAERLADIINLMRKYNIEPKRCQFVHSKAEEEAKILLIEGAKNAKPNMKIEKPLVVYEENGNYSEEIYKIYKMDKEYE